MNPEKIIDFIQYAALWLLFMFTVFMIIQRIERAVIHILAEKLKADMFIKSESFKQSVIDEINKLAKESVKH